MLLEKGNIFNNFNIFFIWLRYSGVIAGIFIIIFTIMYIKNKRIGNKSKQKKYKVLLIISILIIIQDILLWIFAISSISDFFNILENNIGNLII